MSDTLHRASITFSVMLVHCLAESVWNSFLHHLIIQRMDSSYCSFNVKDFLLLTHSLDYISVSWQWIKLHFFACCSVFYSYMATSMAATYFPNCSMAKKALNFVRWLCMFLLIVQFIVYYLRMLLLEYCNVLGVLFTKELYCTPKVNTLQLNTASNSLNTRTRPTCTVPEHSFL
jgi:hypothetical protein